MVPLSHDFMAKLNDPNAQLTETEKVQREWTRFSEGETVTLKGINFRISEIGESRLILKPINKAEFAEKNSSG